MPSVLMSPPLRGRRVVRWSRPGGSGVGRVDHEDLGGPNDAVAEPVARLGDHLGGGHLHLGILPDVAQRLMDLRVERVARLAELDQAGRATTRSSWSATAWKPGSSSPCSRARSMVSSTSTIGASAAYVAFSRTSSRSRSTRRL